MALRDLDIEIDLDVDYLDLLQANAAADQLKDTLSSIKDHIDIHVDLDDNGALMELRHLETLVNDLDNERIHIDVKVDTDGIFAAQSDVALLVSELERLDNATIRVEVNGAQTAIAQLQNIQRIARELSNERIRIEIDVGDITADIAVIRTQLRSIRRHRIDVDVDIAGAMAQIALLQAQLAALQASTRINIGGSIGGGLIGGPLALAMTVVKIAALMTILPIVASVAQVAVGALGTLGVALGVVAGGALSLVSAVGVAAVGLGGFAALAIPSITALYEKGAKLTSAQKYMKGGIEMMTGVWSDLRKELEYNTFKATESGLHALIAGIRVLNPILRSATDATGQLFVNLENSIRGEQMTAFFEYLGRAVEPLTLNIGNGLGNAARGIANLMVALEPLTSWMGQGFENMMERFSNWTFNLQGSEKMTAFIDYIKAELPKIGDILGGATDGIVGFFAAFDVTASDGLNWMAEKMQDFATWSSQLDENQGFQDMLNRIKTDGPIVAETLGNISEHIGSMMSAISDSGALELFNKVFNPENFNYEKMSELFSLKNLFDPMGSLLGAFGSFNLGGMLEALFGGNKPEVEVGVTANTDAVREHLMSLSKTDVIDLAVEADVGMAEAEIGRLTKQEIIDLIVGADTAQVEQQLTTLERERVIEALVNGDTTGLINQINEVTNADNSVDVKVNADTTQAVAEIEKLTANPLPLLTNPLTMNQDLLATMPELKFRASVDTADVNATLASMTPPELTLKASEVEVPQNVPSPEVTLKATDVEMPQDLPTVDITAVVAQLDTSKVGPLSLDIDVSKGNPLTNFTWPPFPSFTWPTLPTFNWPPMPTFAWPALPTWTWPAMPKFSWPAYPKFTWPPMPTVRVSVSGGATDAPGFSSGLGRVSVPEANVNVHKDEAILQDHNAQFLRDIGVLKGDGRNPTIDTNAMANYGANTVPVSTATTTTSNRSSSSVSVGDVHITVQGGNTNEETASAVQTALSQWFNTLSDIFPEVVEG